MPRQFVVTLPGKGTAETSDNPADAAKVVLDNDSRHKSEIVDQLETLKPGDTVFLASGTLIDVVGVLDIEGPEKDEFANMEKEFDEGI